MNTETDYLKSIAEEIKLGTAAETTKPNHHLHVEAKRLEKAITHSLYTIGNFTQRDTFHFNTLSKLVNICDILFETTGTINPNVIELIDLLTTVKQVIPNEIRPNLKLPKAFLAMQKRIFTEIWAKQQTSMQEQQIDKRLIDIAGIPLKRFTDDHDHKLYWGDYTWLKSYQSKLEIMDWHNADCNSKEEALISLLIGRNFNDDRFYIYCKKYILGRLKTVAGKRNKLLEFAKCEKLVLEDTQVGTPAFDIRSNSVSARLLKWIKEEIDFVETHEREQATTKLHFNLYVNRIAFLFKLLSEQKLFGETSFKNLAHQIAGTCLSIGEEEILPATIISKAYPKDQKMLSEMESLLVKMLAYVRSFIRKS